MGRVTEASKPRFTVQEISDLAMNRQGVYMDLERLFLTLAAFQGRDFMEADSYVDFNALLSLSRAISNGMNALMVAQQKTVEENS